MALGPAAKRCAAVVDHPVGVDTSGSTTGMKTCTLTDMNSLASRPLRRAQLALGEALRNKVAGAEAEERSREIWGAEGPRWFTPADPIWRVHDDAAMFVGGITALLVQMLHPGAMAGVGDFSGYKQDPWGRLQRTADYIAMTTFGTIANAEQSIAHVKRIHDRVRGTDAIGNPYWGSDPDLLLFVHDAEIDSFLRAYQAYGPTRLTPEQADTYVAQTATSAERLGVRTPPMSVRELHTQLRGFRRDLQITDSAREACHFVLHNPPVAGPARLGYGLLTGGAVALLPGFARRMLEISVGPRMCAWVLRPAGKATVAAVRWGLAGVDKSTRLPAEFAATHRETLLKS